MANKIEILHSVYRDKILCFETKDLKEAEKYAEEFKYRRTGRSYKKLFHILSSNAETNFLVYPTYKIASVYHRIFNDILSKLDFQYTSYDHLGQTKNLNRTFIFISKEKYDGPEIYKPVDSYTLMDLD